ncbi:MAG: SPOR domain-containing protein [Gammaproteobacteria bacterium]|nr:SPOR domain-containing protein [Gammaproteobacteria bacterium]MDH3766869.1 SPOR domain-containing protein [Gammaproteobacteria bacterium]
MPRDYKHRKTKKKESAPGWMWGLAGLAIGLSVALALHLQDRRNARPSEPVANTAAIPSSARDDSALTEEKSGRSFDFYDILPNFEVVIPETEHEVGKGGVGNTPASNRQTGTYVVQAGSFRTFEDADRMKARLALQGLRSQIQKVTIDEKQWHRVRIGPYSILADAQKTRRQLREADLNVLVLRVGD